MIAGYVVALVRRYCFLFLLSCIPFFQPFKSLAIYCFLLQLFVSSFVGIVWLSIFILLPCFYFTKFTLFLSSACIGIVVASMLAPSKEWQQSPSNFSVLTYIIRYKHINNTTTNIFTAIKYRPLFRAVGQLFYELFSVSTNLSPEQCRKIVELGTTGDNIYIHRYIHTYIHTYIFYNIMHLYIHRYYASSMHTCIHTYIHFSIRLKVHTYIYQAANSSSSLCTRTAYFHSNLYCGRHIAINILRSMAKVGHNSTSINIFVSWYVCMYT